MENNHISSNSNSLFITSHCFEILNEKVLEKLFQKHPNISKAAISQQYGFGNYDENLPSLKSELEQLSGQFVNGKYLYDKKREFQSGKPIIRLNRPYKHLLFEYIECESPTDFLDRYISDPNKRQSQLELLHQGQKSETHYYISYHYGEYKEIVKAQVIAKDNWKNVEYRYLYPSEHGSFREFIYFGTVKKRADTLHIQTRTLMDGKMVESGETLLYIGYGDPGKSKFILGVFSAFDINNRIIAVKTIHEKCSSKEEMERLSREEKIPGYIAQELRNERIENEIHIPNDKLELSNKSPYYFTYEKIAGHYTFTFDNQDSPLSPLEITINPNTYKMLSMSTGVLINRDHFELIQNGTVLRFNFKMTGLASFIQLDIYVKTYYLNKNMEEVKGVFCGIDLENRLVSGETLISFVSSSTYKG